MKLQFFTTFCLPYFDYCLSLCIYYSKTVLTKMHKFYYASLFKLFKFNFVNSSVSVINEFLKKYGLLLFIFVSFLNWPSLFSIQNNRLQPSVSAICLCFNTRGQMEFAEQIAFRETDLYKSPFRLRS